MSSFSSFNYHQCSPEKAAPMCAMWYSQDPKTKQWNQYDVTDTQLLESSYNGRKNDVSLDFCGNVFVVDVKKMVQKDPRGATRKVKREAVQVSKAAVAMFATVAGSNEADVLVPQQFGALFEQLGVNPENEECFIFVYLLHCQGPWKIGKQEFINGCHEQRWDPPTPQKVGASIQQCKQTMKRSNDEYLKFHNYCFRFIRASATAMKIPADENIPILRILLGCCSPVFSRPNMLVDFVAAKTKSISSDLWDSIAQFLLDILDVSLYDDSRCWNSLIDDFVDSQRK